LQQRLLSAVANSYPKQFSRVAWTVGEVEKILVLAHHDPLAGSGVIPDFEVGCLVHFQAKDMDGLVSIGIKEAAKGFRKLVVHQEIHALVSTT
jgi:hypothetical protein